MQPAHGERFCGKKRLEAHGRDLEGRARIGQDTKVMMNYAPSSPEDTCRRFPVTPGRELVPFLGHLAARVLFRIFLRLVSGTDEQSRKQNMCGRKKERVEEKENGKENGWLAGSRPRVVVLGSPNRLWTGAGLLTTATATAADADAVAKRPAPLSV